MLRKLKNAYRHFKRRYPFTILAVGPLLFGIALWQKVLSGDYETAVVLIVLIFILVFTGILIFSMRKDHAQYIQRIEEAQERRRNRNKIRSLQVEYERAIKALSDKIRDNPNAID
jgi:uncharacterized membrane protein